MAWIDVPNYSKVYKGEEKGTYDQDASGCVFVGLQFDSDFASPTTVTLRFKYTATVGLSDKFDILLDPESSSNRKLLHLKETTSYNRGPLYSNSFTLTKAYSAKEFSLPTYWICNLGSSRTMASADDCYTKFSYDKWLGEVMRETVVGSVISVMSEATVAVDGTAPTISIVNKGNNTCDIFYTLGRENTNNAIKSANLYYTLDGSEPRKSKTRVTVTPDLSKKQATVSVNIANGTVTASRKVKVKAYIVCEFEYNNTSKETEAEIPFYGAPGKPGIPKLSYEKSRLTVKEPWTFTWADAAENTKSFSGLSGYYVMLLRKAAGTDEFEYIYGLTDAGNNILGQIENAEPDDWYYLRRESLSTTAIIEDPLAFGFQPGDEVKLRVKSYSWNGTGATLQNPASDVKGVDSTAYLVENAGVMRVKIGSEWKEGQVYVKANGTWHEAESVNVKVNGSWKESE